MQKEQQRVERPRPPIYDHATAASEVFAGPGEVRALCRALDWASTPLGPITEWPETLRDVVRICLDSPFPANLWCGDSLVLIYNDAYRTVLGAKHPAALGKPGTEVWAEIWPDIEPMFASIAQGGPPVFGEDMAFLVERGEDENGFPGSEPNAYFTFSLSPVRSGSDEILAYLNLVSETTGRIRAERALAAALAAAERAEARLLDIFAQAPAFLAVLRGKEHVFEYVNEAYSELVGRRDVVGRPLVDALPEVRGQGFDKRLTDVLESGVPYIGREVPVMISRGAGGASEQRFVDLVYYPITEVDGSRSGVVAHGSDVTDHVVARVEAQRAREAAERANLAKSQFLAMMSHEIRTPINAVLGYSDLLDAQVAGVLSETQAAYVGRIRASSQHLLGLVNNVLDLSKIEAGEMMVDMTDATAATVGLEALEMVAAQATAADVILVKDSDFDREVRFRGDVDRVRQILLNLLSNALKFTPEGGAIRLACRLAEDVGREVGLPDSGPWVVLEVEDTGSGIPPEKVTRVFEPFVQAESGHTRKVTGTGLGLTISRRFARLMGGDLTVRSEPGQGSTFTLWLRPAGAPGEGDADSDWRGPEGGRRGGTAEGGVEAVARQLGVLASQIEGAVVERLRADRILSGSGGVTRIHLANHIGPLLSSIGAALLARAGGADDPALLREAEEVQDLIARRHGLQRRRLGWSATDVRREFQVILDVVDRALREEVPKHTASDLAGALGAVAERLAGAEAVSVRSVEGGR